MKIEGQVRIPSGCAISAVISKDGNKMSGESITNSMKPMHDRSNGLGGGFAGYGIYPEYKEFYALHMFFDTRDTRKKCEAFFMKPMHDRSNGLGGGFAGYGIYPEYKEFYALHMFFDTRDTRKKCEAFLKEQFEIVQSEVIPTRKLPAITDEPIIWRYFVAPLKSVLASMQLDEKEFVAQTVMKINAEMSGAYVFSSGKNMGTFKAVGFPEDVGVFYKLEEYEGYSWTAHGRYPTNTPGWWGGAHPFTLLDYSIVHNGEISSYDANRRFIEMFGYKCTLQTDTEVITYIMDYLLRVQGLTLGEAASVIAAPFWSTIASKTDLEDQKKHTYLRTMFSSLLITGPFSIVLGFNGGLMALNDRLKLRSMVIGEKDDKVFIASEEAAIRTMEPNAENIWSPAGGEPVIVKVKEGAF